MSTADAVLVVARTKAEQVKALVEQLKSAQPSREAVEHRRIFRPWGYYQDVDIAPRYRVKRIVVKPGTKLSLQKHFHRSEHWVVVKGTAEITQSATKCGACTRTNRSISRSAASTAWPIPARFRSN